MGDVIETDRARMVRLVAKVGDDGKVALAAVQAMADILMGSKPPLIGRDEFYRAVSERLEDQ